MPSTTSSTSPLLCSAPRPTPRLACLLALCALGAPACGDDDATPDAGPPADSGVRDAGTPWAGWPACDATATQQRLTFVHANDLHASYTPDDRGKSRWARIRGFYERTRLDSPYTIFTDGGDDHEKGSVADLLSSGRSTLELARAMEFDARVLGNHDFAWSLEELLDFSHDPHALVLASNQHYTGADPAAYGAADFGTLRVGCLTVGFAGLVSTPWDERDQTISEDFYPEITADYDYTTRARALVDAHRGEVDVLVFLDHIGEGDDEALAAAVPGIDVILSSHSHTLTAAPVVVGDTVVVQAGSSGDFVIRLDLDVELATHAVNVADYTIKPVFMEAPSAPMNDAVTAAMATYAPEAFATLGSMSRVLDAAGAAELAARASLTQLSADAAIIDVNTAWGSLSAGPLTQQELADTFKVERERAGTPGFSSLYRATVSGAVLALVASAPADRWRYVGPATVDPAATYTLVVQKRPAMHPDEYLPAGVLLDAPTAQAEVWETLDHYARARNAACLYVDVDTSIPGCTP
jgi:2',3'-cyclic-nucleotide 2'-phosphodiesterase (5'-nucleotidase family)